MTLTQKYPGEDYYERWTDYAQGREESPAHPDYGADRLRPGTLISLTIFAVKSEPFPHFYKFGVCQIDKFYTLTFRYNPDIDLRRSFLPFVYSRNKFTWDIFSSWDMKHVVISGIIISSLYYTLWLEGWEKYTAIRKPNRLYTSLIKIFEIALLSYLKSHPIDALLLQSGPL